MAEPTFGQAQFRWDGSVIEARMSRIIDDSLDRVWVALTDCEELVKWLAPGEIELRLGGSVKLNFADSGIVIDSMVTALDPLALLEYSWSGPGEPLRPVRFEIRPAGDAVHLDLTLRLPAGEDVGRSCAGWDAHLEMLAAALAGVPIKFPFEHFKQARDVYRARLAN